MKYVKPALAAASLAVCAVLTSVTGQASAADLTKAAVSRDTTFQCSDRCGLPGGLVVAPRAVVGPDATDPALRVAPWPRTVYITCVFDATDGARYRVYVEGWKGQWWVAKTNTRSAPGVIDAQSIPPCREVF